MMRRAIALAMRGRGTVEPNPSVGCVIVKDGRVIGEGYTQPFGGAHAEPTALANCTESPIGATAYVTLEPCCHTNKKTPPCVPAVITAGIKRVVYGSLDPNPDVNGKGIEMLRRGGVECCGPLLQTETNQLIAPFWKRVNLRRPYVTLKWAQSSDGKVSGPGGVRTQISNESSIRQVHELRARSDAVMVGAGTLRTDDPLLTARGVDVVRQPTAMVLASLPSTVEKSRLFRERPEDLVVFGAGHIENRFRVAGVKANLCEVERAPDGRLSLTDVVRQVGEAYKVTHLLVEPGPTLGRSFFQWGLVDRVWVFQSSKAIGDASALPAPLIPDHYVKVGEVNLSGDTLAEWLNPASEAFFAPVESADFVRVRRSVQNGSD
jgi:diaminohydroxyphosphoribosylaminopyrimidine deaminase/5-amino-6-(5-phosphoribosylamino)uracil reductase